MCISRYFRPVNENGINDHTDGQFKYNLIYIFKRGDLYLCAPLYIGTCIVYFKVNPVKMDVIIQQGRIRDMRKLIG